jgi:acyl dehydratase
MNAYVVGQVLPGAAVTVTSELVDRYADVSGDHNPIHLDENVAARAGLPGRIAHGMLTMGLLGTTASGWAGGAGNIVSLRCRFSRPVPLGEELSFSGRVVEVDGDRVTVEAEVVGRGGEPALGRAAVVFLG